MGGLILSYLIFNIITGIVLTVKFHETEGGIFKSKAYWGLLFFPVVGWGKWLFHQELKSSGKTEFPESWFIAKQMIKLHWIYIITIGAIVILSLILLGGYFTGIFDYAIKPSGDSGNGIGEVFDFGLGVVAGMGLLLMFALFLISAAFMFAILILFLIFIPKNRMKKIESDVYKQKYFEVIAQNKS